MRSHIFWHFILVSTVILFNSCSKEQSETGDIGKLAEEKDTCTFNPNFINLVKYGAHLSTADTLNNTYILEFREQIPEIVSGSVLSLDADSLGYLVRVTSVKQDGSIVKITAEEASLCDLFANTSFVLSTSVEQESSTKSGNCPIFYPISISYRNEDGVLTTYDTGTKSISGYSNLWKNGINYDGKELIHKGNFSIIMDESNISGALDMEFHLSFGGLSTLQGNIIDTYVKYRSKSLSINSKLIGKLNVNQVARAHINGAFNTSDGKNLSEYNELIKHKVLPDVNLKFSVAGVPIWIKVGTDLFREVNLQGEGSLDFTFGFHNSTILTAGSIWSQSGGISPVGSATNKFSLVGPELTGEGKLTGKFWPFYPRISVRFYGMLGPTFDIKPFLKTSLEGGFQLSVSDNYAAWTLNNYAGLDFKAGISTFFMNYESNRYFETNDINIVEKTLYTSPVDLKRIGEESCIPGRKSTLTFEVYDHDDIFDTDVKTVLPQFVTFEGDGKLSETYAIARSGTVSVDWTPLKSGDEMYAILYGPSGQVIKKTTVTTKKLSMDLGLSVKWAICNVGASSPEEYGDYYAWGETNTKAVYNQDTYTLKHKDKDGCWVDDNLGPNISGTQYDVAHVKWGGGWRMPTMLEMTELYENCTLTDTDDYNGTGVAGVIFTSNKKGYTDKYIFLPFAGERDESVLKRVDKSGHYWPSTPYTDYFVCDYLLSSLLFAVSGNSIRYRGCSIRPVCD